MTMKKPLIRDVSGFWLLWQNQMLADQPWLSRKRSASSAAMQPVPAEVIA